MSASSADPLPAAPENVAPMDQQVSENVDPAGDDDTFVIDRTLMDTRNRDDRTPPTATRASKKSKPTSEAQRQLDERAPAQHRSISSTGGSTEQKRPRVL